MDVRNSPISYVIESSHFSVDMSNGRVYLIAKLEPNVNSAISYQTLSITATNGVEVIRSENRIAIVNANNQEPEFLTTQRIFEIFEVCLYIYLFIYNMTNGQLYLYIFLI